MRGGRFLTGAVRMGEVSREGKERRRGKKTMSVLSIRTVSFLGLVLLMLSASRAIGDELTIHDIQSNTTDGDASVYACDPANVDQIIDCAGGVVIGKFRGFKPRVILQDPDYPAGWGAIQVKDWVYHSDVQEWELYDNVEIGDWVSLTNVWVEEFRGTTMLHYQSTYTPGFTLISQGNPVLDAVELTAADLAFPLDHGATELYESMVVTLEQVVVGQMDLGKADDNYELIQGSDVVWAADYMNAHAGGPYDPRIETGAGLVRVTGLVEQYTDAAEGWDYYQLCTRSRDDLLAAADIPTISQWGIVVMLLSIAAAGSIMWRRERVCEA